MSTALPAALPGACVAFVSTVQGRRMACACVNQVSMASTAHSASRAHTAATSMPPVASHRTACLAASAIVGTAVTVSRVCPCAIPPAASTACVQHQTRVRARSDGQARSAKTTAAVSVTARVTAASGTVTPASTTQPARAANSVLLAFTGTRLIAIHLAASRARAVATVHAIQRREPASVMPRQRAHTVIPAVMATTAALRTARPVSRTAPTSGIGLH